MKLAGILAATLAAAAAWATFVFFSGVALFQLAQGDDDPTTEAQTESAQQEVVESPETRDGQFLFVDHPEPPEDIVDYWTTARMASAIPQELMDLKYKPRDSSKAEYDYTPLTDKAQREADSRREDDPNELGFPRTIGALFFLDAAGKPSSCSASVIDSESDSTIMTAAQCIYTPEKGAHSKIMFVPAYDYGPYSEYGTWPVHNVRTFTQWVDDKSPRHDIAFLEVYLNDNVTISETVGNNTLVTDVGPVTTDTTVWGYQRYPGEDPDIRPYFCNGVTIRSHIDDTNAVDCTFMHGMQGSPWFATKSETHSNRKVWAVSSRGTHKDISFGTPVVASTKKLLNTIP